MISRLDEVSSIINSGTPIMVAGGADMMRRLPRGNWIGGTTPFILGSADNAQTRDSLFINVMPPEAKLKSIQRYGMGGLHMLPEDVPDNGFTLVIMPTGTLVHQAFAKEAPHYPGIYSKTLSGWVSGSKSGHFSGRPQVFYGPRGHCMDDEVVAMHMELPENLVASVEMINVFEPEERPIIRFPNDGFITTHATIDGESVNFAEYLTARKANLDYPLLADYCGARINVSIKQYDVASGQVSFYGPLFRNVDYRFAKPVTDMKQKLMNFLPKDGTRPVFSCICVSNYMQGMLQDFPSSNFDGPVAYGEIAHLLLNQTMTYLRIVKK